MDKSDRKLMLKKITPITGIVIGVIVLLTVILSMYYYYNINYLSIATTTPEGVIVENLQSSMFKILVSMLPSAALSITALIGVYLTYHSIQSSKSSSRKQLTIQLVTDVNENKRLQDTKNLIFLKGNELPQYYSQLNDHTHKQQLEDNIERDVRNNKDMFVGNRLIRLNIGFLRNSRKLENDVKKAKERIKDSILKDEMLKDDIHYVLNYYEQISLGIRVEAFEEDLFKNLHYSSFMKLWKCAHPLILQIRTISGKDTIYQEIEILAMKWKNEPIKSHFPMK